MTVEYLGEVLLSGKSEISETQMSSNQIVLAPKWHILG